MKTLIAIPVYNEVRTVRRVLAAVREQADHVLVIDDGSTDGTGKILEELRGPLGLTVLFRNTNLGYGRALIDAFALGQTHGYDWVITMDCDEQHEPASIPRFVRRAGRGDLDIVSGSRYMDERYVSDQPPADRRAINAALTTELNERLGLGLTDSFCGFKAHRVGAMRRLELTETGYAFPMQLWVQAAAHGLRVGEIPVHLIYNDPNRSFGGPLDDAGSRLDHYRCALYGELGLFADRLPARATAGMCDKTRAESCPRCFNSGSPA